MVKPPKPTQDNMWDIIRYAPGSGRFATMTPLASTGWYARRGDALVIAQDWAARYPQWIVALVKSDLVWSGDGNFATVAHRPLTERERRFANGDHARRTATRSSSGPMA
jgi:hypothetical protein